MDFSSSSSSSSSFQYKSPIFPSNTSKPLWDLPIYHTTPPPMESRVFTLNSLQENARLPSSFSYSNYPHNYTNYSYSGTGAGGGGPAVEEEGGGGEREHMFEKVVTPSDVGKLNRLVIPKQNAEKYFPLDSAAGDKGLLLSFEDRTGKSWRFRYSYWNSSQSYVITKGWSRFVKDKKLDAGDVVSFLRGVGDAAKDRLYIDWRRRPKAPPSHYHHYGLQPPEMLQFHHGVPLHRSFFLSPRPQPPPPLPPFRHHQHHHLGSMGRAMVFESVPVVHGRAAAGKRLRLFGVNMDCSVSDPRDKCDHLASSPLISSQDRQQRHLDLLDSQLSSSELQLRLHSGVNSAVSGKGKSSMSLDLDI